MYADEVSDLYVLLKYRILWYKWYMHKNAMIHVKHLQLQMCGMCVCACECGYTSL